MSLTRADWFGIGFLSAGFAKDISKFLKYHSSPEERLGDMEEFLKSCERGEALVLGDLEKCKGVKFDDISKYARAFYEVDAENSVRYYLNHLSKLREGNRQSTKVVYNFSRKLCDLALEKIESSQYNSCGLDFIA